ncbi:MAG TPA: 30S ribosomal protein S18 [Candidatus Absconditabacterales bacterium]|nr:30S ribosomal protein S18 [Candidatus Absconditabacterales bacterium]HMT26743.1 30S ribosomal protein S18 [Candidatus Absconditabacterales bacterium]
MKKKNIFQDAENLQYINRKAVSLLKNFVTRFGEIKPRKYTGNTVKIQKKVKNEIIRAREIGVLPYTK